MPKALASKKGGNKEDEVFSQRWRGQRICFQRHYCRRTELVLDFRNTDREKKDETRMNMTFAGALGRRGN
jgi:hypothetical protein